MRSLVFIACVGLLVAAPIALVLWVAPGPSVVEAPEAVPRELALIVPGTLASDWTWFAQVPGSTSFAAELSRGFAAAGDRSLVVRRLLWDANFRQSDRAAAAAQLAREIDEAARGYDRVHLVGHSHGGNVALAAAARTRRVIDTVACLATPHLFYELRRPDVAESAWVPLFVPPDLGDHVRRLIDVRIDDDVIALDLAPWLNGISDAEALELTRGWLREAQDLVAADDGVLARLMGSSRVRAAPRLTPQEFARLESVVVPSTVDDAFERHSQVHSLAMGFALGEVLAGRPAEPVLRSILLPDGGDEGELVPLERRPEIPAPPRGAWLAAFALELGPTTDVDVDDSPPDPRLRINGDLVAEATDVTVLEQDVGLFVPDGRVVFEVGDGDLVRTQPLGEPVELHLEGGALPDQVLSGDETAPAWRLELTSWPVR